MSAIFDFSSLITVFVLSICTTTFLRELRPAIFDTTVRTATPAHAVVGGTTTTTTTMSSDNNTHDTFMDHTGANTDPTQQQQQQYRQRPHHHRDGMMGFLWKLSRIGERCSPYICIACILQAMNILFWK
jgi:hypothetical protein